MGLFDRVSDKIPKTGFDVDSHRMGTLFTEFGYAWHTFKPYVLLLLGSAFAFFLIRLLKDRYED